ncbi:cyclic GMP-AMP synthase-like receptor isoform X5 [Condylostylus longicornis]|uniref:cyclic GMP-AMP synthase-like receptor isoform X5 n=1 Tax=Condylostylus longicornis TaxID=2530218 RepID=UPI00244DC48F|nr:cyclic GMP-AMP synthase-like receptor isoform X5 [Condylostylus longicornis]
MSTLDEVLKQINSKFITISNTDRGPYAKHYDFVRDTIILKLKEIDKIFDKLYRGHCLGGSYADNIKISKPDEYDLVLRLKLRECNLIKVTKDPKLPGYCNINIKEAMEKIKTEKQNEDIYKHFEKLIDKDGFIIQEKIQRWIESSMTKALNELNNGKWIIRNGENLYEIKYTKSGPAHTINVTIDKKFFSVDLVPAFVFDKTKWIAKRPLPSNTPLKCQDWIAVPKPVKSSVSPNISFITSYVDTERHLIKDRCALKSTLKMIKKLRDTRNLHNLKSYFIKTIYLWETERQPENFWDKSIRIVLLHMMDRLIEYLEKGNIPFFWDRSQNMLGNLDKNQIKSILNEITSARKIMETNISKVYDLFLTPDEKKELFKSLSQTEIPILLSDNLKTPGLQSIIDNGNSKIKNQTEADKKVCEIKQILEKKSWNQKI